MFVVIREDLTMGKVIDVYGPFGTKQAAVDFIKRDREALEDNDFYYLVRELKPWGEDMVQHGPRGD